MVWNLCWCTCCQCHDHTFQHIQYVATIIQTSLCVSLLPQNHPRFQSNRFILWISARTAYVCAQEEEVRCSSSIHIPFQYPFKRHFPPFFSFHINRRNGKDLAQRPFSSPYFHERRRRASLHITIPLQKREHRALVSFWPPPRLRRRRPLRHHL